MEEEIKELEKENDKLWEELLTYTNYENRDKFKDLVNELIDNEIEQESYCNQ